MTTSTHGWAGHVMTTEGLVPGDQLGTTLPHEHIVLDGWSHTSTNYPNSLQMELVKVPAAGGRTVVDVGTNGVGRDPTFTHRAGTMAGIRTVVATGVPKEAWIPADLLDASAKSFADMMEREIASVMSGAGSLMTGLSFWSLTSGRGPGRSAASLEQVQQPARLGAARHDRPDVDHAVVLDHVVGLEVADRERGVVAEDLDRVADAQRAGRVHVEDRVLLVEPVRRQVPVLEDAVRRADRLAAGVEDDAIGRRLITDASTVVAQPKRGSSPRWWPSMVAYEPGWISVTPGYRG